MFVFTSSYCPLLSQLPGQGRPSLQLFIFSTARHYRGCFASIHLLSSTFLYSTVLYGALLSSALFNSTIFYCITLSFILLYSIVHLLDCVVSRVSQEQLDAVQRERDRALEHSQRLEEELHALRTYQRSDTLLPVLSRPITHTHTYFPSHCTCRPSLER